MLNSYSVFAVKIYGNITDNKQQPLPFANIYIKGTTTGTTSNEIGKYQLELSAGNYEIIYHYIGYKKVIKDVVVGNTDIELNIALAEEDVQLKEVVVSAKEDPAYAIMRKAIEKRDYYYNQVKEYRCNVYTKGLQRIVSAPDKVMGISINSTGILDSNNTGIIYLSESVSEYSFKYPDLVKEKMIASKVSGNSNNFSWNSASDFNTIDLYKNNLSIDVVTDRIIISPLADNAMMYYKYRLLGITVEDGRMINKIQVIPKRKADPVYSGIIYINDSLYNLNSFELFLTKDAQIKFFDTIKISQTFVPIKEDIWMPISKRFDITFGFLKIKAEGYYLAIYKDYNLQPEFSKKYFTNEVLNIDEASNKKDTAYWNELRPVQLTEDEVSDYTRKDSLEILRESKAHLDSLDKKANRFKPINILLGYNFRKSYHKLNIRTNPLFNAINFNTVEGYNISFGLTIDKEFEKKKLLRITPAFRYGIANKLFGGTLNASYYYNRKKSGYIAVEGGQYIQQFNKAEPIGELTNTIYTLLREKNYLKIYNEQYITIKHRYEIANGLMLWASTRYSRRIPLANSNVAPWVNNKEKTFTPNIPDNAALNGMPFRQHDAFFLVFDLRYRPGQKYVTRPDMKIATDSKFPEFTLTYIKSIPGVFKSNLNFDQLQFKIEDNISLKILGNTEYLFRTGLFLNKERIEFMNYKHFNGNQTILGRNYFDGFQLLDYYAASTIQPYYEAHLQHHFDGFFFNKIPGFRKLKFQEVLGVHFMYNKDYKDWVEISAGIENIARIARVDFVTGLSRNHPTRFGVRVGIDLGLFQ
jgi:hypothetical protein